LTYQKKVSKLIYELFDAEADVYVEQWISYVDRRGPGYAQPDVFLVFPGHTVCFEAKLTQCEAGLLQISQLYRPLLRSIFKRPVVGVLACCNIVSSPGQYLLRSPELVAGGLGCKEETYTWHWNGR
jgi:hypothetical protein